jgi:hypothetical protein
VTLLSILTQFTHHAIAPKSSQPPNGFSMFALCDAYQLEIAISPAVFSILDQANI